MFLLSLVAFGQAQSPSPAPTAAGQAVITAVNHATSALPTSVPSGILVALGFILTELMAHGIPTSKPISWFLFLEAIVDAIVTFLQKLQSLLKTLGNALQNTAS